MSESKEPSRWVRDGQPFRWVSCCCPNRLVADYQEIKKNIYAHSYRYRAGRYEVFHAESKKLNNLFTRGADKGDKSSDMKNTDGNLVLQADHGELMQLFLDGIFDELNHLHDIRVRWFGKDLNIRFRDRWNGFFNFQWCLAFGCFERCRPDMSASNLKYNTQLLIQQDLLTRYHSEMYFMKKEYDTKESKQSLKVSNWNKFEGRMPKFSEDVLKKKN